MNSPSELAEAMLDEELHKTMAKIQAQTAREYFEQLMEQGFTEEEAFELVKYGEKMQVEF